MQAIYQHGPVIHFPYTGGTDLAMGTRVKLDATNGLAVSGDADEADVGVVYQDYKAGAGIGSGGKTVPVLVKGFCGIVWFVAASAITVRATVFKAASGRVDDTGTRVIGQAVAAAGAAGEIVPVLVGPLTGW